MTFTGLVQGIGKARWVSKGPSGCHRLAVVSPGFFQAAAIGDSICVDGVCLTIIEISDDKGEALFEVMEETRRITNFNDDVKSISRCEMERSVNLEKALGANDRFGGHCVSGHVHGLIQVIRMERAADGSANLWFGHLRPDDPSPVRVTHKGSVTISGVSLTVAEVEKDFRSFRVSLIPHTQAVTNLGLLGAGDVVNVEWEDGSLFHPTTSCTSDEKMMQLALVEAEKGRFSAAPNPHVGCVIAVGEWIIGKGFHRRAGDPHAEVMAVNDAIRNGFQRFFSQATLFVTLEPCSHHGRTPPCIDLIKLHGFSHVVVGLEDPDGRVKGTGIAALRAAGITVTTGVLAEDIRNSLLSYLHHRTFHRPRVVAKVALSLDGCIACVDGTSQWITSEPARADVAAIRAESQAILVGTGTVFGDNPRLTVREVKMEEAVAESFRQPIRVILDGQGRLFREGDDDSIAKLNIMNTDDAPTIVFTTRLSSDDVEKEKHEDDAFRRNMQLLTRRGVEVVFLEKGRDGHGVDLQAVLSELDSRGVLQVMVEGGGKIHESFLREDLVDELIVFKGPTILGGISWMGSAIASTLSAARFWKLHKVTQFEDTVKMVYRRTPSP